MNLQLRLETPVDYRAVEELTREAFGSTLIATPLLMSIIWYTNYAKTHVSSRSWIFWLKSIANWLVM